MQCSCGGSTVAHTHNIKSISGFLKWVKNVKFDQPFKIGRIERDVCESCGRAHTRVYKYAGKDKKVLIDKY